MNDSILLEFLKAYMKTSKNMLGANEKEVAFKTGERVGEFYSKQEIIKIKEEFKKLNMELITQVDDRNVICTVSNSFEYNLRRGLSPSCHFLRGFLTGMWKGRISAEKVKCEETECRTKGNKNCVFIIKEEVYLPRIEGKKEERTIDILRKLRV